MILGADHLAVSAPPITPALLEAAEGAGYETLFTQHDLPNSLTKKPFLSVHEPLHAIAYCRSSASVSLEFTAHAAPLSRGPSWYQVLMAGPDNGTGPYEGPLPCGPDDWRTIFGEEGVRPCSWAPFQAQHWRVPRPSDGASAGPVGSAAAVIRGVLVPAARFDDSVTFWTAGLGGKPAGEGGSKGRRWMKLTWSSPVRRWSVAVGLLETDAAAGTKPALDRAGFSCIAFLTNSLPDERPRLVGASARRVSEPSEHVINGKTIRILFAEGPSGELVELMEVRSK